MTIEWPRGAIPCLTSGAVAERSHPTSEVRGSGREELPHIQTEVAAPGAGGPRGATPCSRSGGATSFKVRSSSCALLEQP